MAILRSFWTNFSAGWLTDKVQDRIDLDAYRNGAAIIQDWRLLLQGGLTRRQGMAYDATLPIPVGTAINIKSFSFDAGESYSLIFSPLRLDIFSFEGALLQSLVLPAGSDYWETDASVLELDTDQRGDSMYITQRDMHIWELRRTGLSTFELVEYEFDRDQEFGFPLEPMFKYAPSSTTIRLSDEDLTTTTALLLQTNNEPATDVASNALDVVQGIQVVHDTLVQICGAATKRMSGGNVLNDLVQVTVPPASGGTPIAEADLLDLAGKNFTVEGDLNIPSTGGNLHHVVGQWPGAPNNSWRISYDDGPGEWLFSYSSDGTNQIDFTVPHIGGQFNGENWRLAVTRRGEFLYWHINGNYQDSFNIGATAINPSTGNLSFGGITENNNDNRSINIGQWLMDVGTGRYSDADYFQSCPLTSALNVISTTATLSDPYWVDPDHVGIHCRAFGENELGEIQYLDFFVAQVISPTEAEITLLRSASDTTFVVGTTRFWEEQAFSDLYGWPIACLVHDQRLMFGGGKSIPDHYFASVIKQFYNFDVGQGLDDDAISYSVEGDKGVNIRSLASMRGIQVFSAEEEFYLPITANLPLTPSNTHFVNQTQLGSSFLRPKAFDGAILFVPKSGASVREFLFADAENAYNADSVSALSGEVLSSPIDMDVQLESEGAPEQYAYFVNDDGTMPVFMSMRREGISGWVQYSTDGLIKGVEEIERRVFVVVERDLANGSVLTLEHFDQSHTLDSSIVMTSPTPSRIWDGLDHLANQEVMVRSGTRFMGSFTVDASGRLTMPASSDDAWSVTEIEVGLNYTPIFSTLKPEFQLQDGVTWGEKRKVVRTLLKLLNALDVSVDGQRIRLLSNQFDLTKAPEPVTEDREFRHLAGWDFDGRVTVMQEAPLPCTIKAIMVEVEY